MYYISRSDLVALSERTTWIAAGTVFAMVIAMAAVVMSGFGIVSYQRDVPAAAAAPSWFIRPALLNEQTSFFELDPNAPNPSYIPFQTAVGPSIGTTFSLGGDAFDVSHENYTTVLRTGVYEFTLHVTLITLSPDNPTTGVVMMNSTRSPR